mmetsp:Transcript_2384/g.3661  ORF Transcript_2384/g.3661 Transcript_2384/m.3661 type:complete len:560 (-) Transcript_2384:8-1687(-)
MSALKFFELFNEILLYRVEDDGNKAYLLKEIMNYEGKFQKDLFEFILWLISNNDREVYFSGQCNIKFKHFQSDANLMKVVVFPNSCCMVHKSFNEWTAKVVVQWQRHCEIIKQKLAPKDVDSTPESSKLNNNEVVLESNKLEQSNSLKKNSHGVNLDDDLYEMLQEMESQLVAAHKKFSKSVVTEENLSSQDLLNEIHAVSAGGSENGKEALQIKLQKMNERIRNLNERSIVQKATLRQNDSIMSLESLHDMDRSPSISVKGGILKNSSVRSFSSYAHHNESNQALDKSASPSYDNSNKSSMFLSDQDYVQSVFRSSKSLTDLARLPHSQLSKMSVPLNRSTSHDSTESFNSQSYAYIMSHMQQSESMSSFGEATTAAATNSLEVTDIVHKIPKSLSFSKDVDVREEKEDVEDEEKMDIPSTLQSSGSLQLSLKNLPTSSKALSVLFNVESYSVFDGELVAKKSTGDFMYKKRYLWINPATRSLHWAKSLQAKSESKFIILKRTKNAIKPDGYIKGVVHSAEFGPKGLVVCTEAGDSLELKLPSKSLNDWQKVFLTLIG